MTGAQEERLVKAAEALAISAAHGIAGWLALHYNSARANLLLDQVELKLDWKMQRYTK